MSIAGIHCPLPEPGTFPSSTQCSTVAWSPTELGNFEGYQWEREERADLKQEQRHKRATKGSKEQGKGAAQKGHSDEGKMSHLTVNGGLGEGRMVDSRVDREPVAPRLYAGSVSSQWHP